jgi:hypothetical protein
MLHAIIEPLLFGLESDEHTRRLGGSGHESSRGSPERSSGEQGDLDPGLTA